LPITRPTIGFHCSHEQYPPSTLLKIARGAADAGFASAMCSDHFAPWTERQGHSGFAWSWLGAALEATTASWGTVCAPGQRYHPAVIAQASATLAEMYPDQFWLAIGSGEALNESITGQSWPSKSVRNERLRESADVIRALWAGDTVSHRGHVSVHDARLFVRPARPPLLLGAALTPETAAWIGTWADGLITVAGPRDSMRSVVDAFQTTGPGKPMFLQVALAFAPSEQQAAAAALDQWRQAVVGAARIADLASPAAVAAAAAHATIEEVERSVRISADVERHLAWIEQDAELGFERIYLHNVARGHQRCFIDTFASRVLPHFR
jgi:probable non-F420 flavinoid oxidoreductase